MKVELAGVVNFVVVVLIVVVVVVDEDVWTFVLQSIFSVVVSVLCAWVLKVKSIVMEFSIVLLLGWSVSASSANGVATHMVRVVCSVATSVVPVSSLNDY